MKATPFNTMLLGLTALCGAAVVGCGGGDSSSSGDSTSRTTQDGMEVRTGDQGTLFFSEDDGSGAGTAAGGTGSGDGCAPNFTGIVRDFQFSHPDFEAYSGPDASEGIVAEDLGDDGKPVYNTASPNMHNGAYIHPDYGQQTTSKEDFDQWYRTSDVNREIKYTLPLDGQEGHLVFDSHAFFPADDKGFGNEGTDGHNFAFTFELHTEFRYDGGEVFTFVGDDDLWAFINGKLAVDDGGLHPATSRSIDLDAAADRLGIEVGQTYRLELFHAERHTNQSNFHIETNIAFTNCEPIFTVDVAK